MGLTYKADAVTPVTVVTTTETQVVAVTGASAPRSGMPVRISSYIKIFTGTVTSALQFRCYRGSFPGGAQVGSTIQVASSGGTDVDHYFEFSDDGAEMVAGAYVITIQQVGATANGRVDNGTANVTIGQFH